MLLIDEAVLEEEEQDLNKMMSYLLKIANREKCSISIGINAYSPQDPFPEVMVSGRHICFPDMEGKGYWAKILNKEGKYAKL